MPTFNVTVGNAQYEVDAPDENTAWKWASATHAPQPDKPEESELFKAGRQVPEWAQGVLKLGDVASKGLAKKMIGPQSTEMIRGATTQFGEEHPVTSFLADIAGAAPEMLIAPEAAAARVIPSAMTKQVSKQVMSLPERMIRSGSTGAVQGGLSGLGQSSASTPQGQISDALKSAAFGLGGGAAATGVGNILGMVASPTGQAIARGQAGNAAAKRYALALQRDLPESFPGSVSDYARQRLSFLGPEGSLSDIGESTRSLADVLATLPGRAKGGFENLIESRQAGRAGRMMGSAEDVLGKQGVGYTATLDALAERQRSQAEPLYAALRMATVPVDDELLGMLQAAGKEALGKAKRLARLAGEDQISLQGLKDSRDIITNAIIPGKQLDFKALDHVKQSLYDLESRFARAGEKQEAAAFGNLRRRLTSKLDELSPKDDAGESIYKKARDAFAGPAQLSDAVELGRTALSADAVELEKQLAELGAGELDAFRTGAIQALREKTGTESGQTSLLKYWKEPKTADSLRRIFGNNYENFTEALDAERQLKKLESVGRGSQTAPRLFAAGDLDLEPVMEGGQVIASGMNPSAFAAWATKQWNRTKMPEKTRNQLAAMLTQRGGNAEQELRTLDAVLKQMERGSARRSALAGALGSTGTTKLRNE